MEKPQTLANHAKFDPSFHFFLIPVLLINLILIGIQLFRFPGWLGAWLLVMALALCVMAARMRSSATHLQDRIIRVEERLRLAAVLEEPLRSRIGELTDAQLVGLRFASDAELPALAQRALDEKLSRSDIKKAIADWRPDYSRV
jgi:low affinity Fe/Cu permease